MPYKELAIRDFMGVNEEEAPELMAENELVFAQNVSRNGSAYGTRPGLAFEPTQAGAYDAAIAGGGFVQGGVEYLDRRTTGELVTIVAGNVYSDPATAIGKGAVVITAGAASAPRLWTFAQHKNELYGAGGADGDSVWRWTGSGTLTVVTFQNAAAAAIDAKFIFEKWNYGFLCGMNGTLPEDNPMVIRFSALNDMTSWPVADTIGGTSAIGGLSSYGDEKLTGFGDFVDNEGDWLLALSNRQIYPILQTADPDRRFHVGSAIANGCISQHCFVNLGLDSGDAIYLSERGIHSIRQSQRHGAQQDQFLSWKIRRTFDRINQTAIQNAVAGYFPREGLVLFAVPTGSNTQNDTILCLDLKNVSEITARSARWSIWSLAQVNACSLFISRDLLGVLHLYAGSYDGKVGRLQRTAYSDYGQPYAIRMRTKHNDFGSALAEKVLGDVIVEGFPSGGYKPVLRFIYDRGQRSSSAEPIDMSFESAVAGDNWDEGIWDEFSWAGEAGAESVFSSKHWGHGGGATLGFEIAHTAANEPLFLTKLAYAASILGAEEGALD